MKSIKYKILKACIFSMIAVFSSACLEDISELNENPNNPIQVPANFLLPSATVQATYYLGGDFNRATSFWVQHWATTGGQFQRLDRYDVTSGTFNTAWGQIYAGALNDLQIIIDESEELSNYRAQARTLKVFYYQMMTDLWGEIPYSEALKGNEGNITPVYDNQLDIYNLLIEEVNTALSEIDTEAPAIVEDDLLFGGDLELWRKFANSIKLKLYLRLVEVDASTATAGIQEILNGSVPLLEQGDDVELIFGTRLETNANPLFQQEFNRPTDYGASQTVVGILEQLNDPRISVFLRPDANGQFTGVENGNPNDLPTDANGNFIVSRIGSVYVQETSPVSLMTYYDIKFMEAEAAVRGIVNAENAQQLYEEAVSASFDYYGIPVGNYLNAGEPAAYDANNALEQLMTQRYISLFGRGVEAYNEWRKSGIPALTPASNNTSGGQIPLRFPYVNAEVTNNPGNVPSVNVYNNPVAWDVN